MAILPFTPVQGNIYTLSADMNPISVPDPSDWFVIGFINRGATDNWFTGGYSASAGARGSNSVYPDFYYNGPGLSGKGKKASGDAEAKASGVKLQSLACSTLITPSRCQIHGYILT